MPTKFEKALLDAAVDAWKFNYEMTGGAYLYYTHESFLQNYIAIKIFKSQRFCIYIDASPRKIRDGSDSTSKKPPSNMTQRFDLVFWHKTKNQAKAIVEIKRAWSQPPVINDVEKLLKYIDKKDAGGAAGYVLYYTDTIEKREAQDAVQLIIRRFNKVNDTMRDERGLIGLVHSVDSHIYESGNHAWGFALYRASKPKPRRPGAPVAP